MENIISNNHCTFIAINTPCVMPTDPGTTTVIAIGLKAVQSGNLVQEHRESLLERKEWLKI